MNMEDPTAVIALEALIFSRYQSGITGRSRRTGGTLDQSAYILLTLLDAAGPSTIADLSAATGLETSTLNRQTSTLVREGLADRVPNLEGGIARMFRLNEAGSQALAEEREATVASLAEFTREWEPRERDELAALLRKLNLAIEAENGRRWPRPE